MPAALLTPPPLDGFRHATPIQIRWGDVDALGHVNNATYLTYLEQARITWFGALALWDGTTRGAGVIIARCEIDYRAPLYAEDAVVVYTRCARLGNRSFDTEQVIARLRGDSSAEIEIAAQSRIVLVVYDYNAGRSTVIPEAWRDRVRAYEATPPTE